MPLFATVPGVYVVDRDAEPEVCRVNLRIAMFEASGRYEARLLDRCHDSGLQVFNPVAWRYAAGRLTLQARQGHEVTLISERDGQWRRNPDVGTTLLLRKARRNVFPLFRDAELAGLQSQAVVGPASSCWSGVFRIL